MRHGAEAHNNENLCSEKLRLRLIVLEIFNPPGLLLKEDNSSSAGRVTAKKYQRKTNKSNNMNKSSPSRQCGFSKGSSQSSKSRVTTACEELLNEEQMNCVCAACLHVCVCVCMGGVSGEVGVTTDGEVLFIEANCEEC